MTGVGRKELAVERFAIKDLIAWKNSPRRRPLLVQGARQVGKTWLIREFGQTHFAAVAYVNFLEDEAMARQFEGELAPARLLDAVTLYTGVNAKDPNTLVVLTRFKNALGPLPPSNRSPSAALKPPSSLPGRFWASPFTGASPSLSGKSTTCSSTPCPLTNFSSQPATISCWIPCDEEISRWPIPFRSVT